MPDALQSQSPTNEMLSAVVFRTTKNAD